MNRFLFATVFVFLATLSWLTHAGPEKEENLPEAEHQKHLSAATFREAVSRGDHESIDRFIAENGVNWRDDCEHARCTILMHLAAFAPLKTLQAFLENDAIRQTVNLPDIHGFTALMHAVKHNQQNNAIYLVEAGEARIEMQVMRDGFGYSALTFAYQCNQELYKELLKRVDKVRLLFEAIQHHNFRDAHAAFDCLAREPQRLFNINTTTLDGITPLQVAAFFGDCGMLDWLLSIDGIEVDHQVEKNEPTALMIAAWRGHCDVAERLCQAGAKPEKYIVRENYPTDQQYWNACTFAAASDCKALYDALHQLIPRRAQYHPNAVESDAFQRWHPQSTVPLPAPPPSAACAHTVPAAASDDDTDTLMLQKAVGELEQAIEKCEADTLLSLCQANPLLINTIGPQTGFTPLMIGILSGHFPLVDFLMRQHNIDLTIRDYSQQHFNAVRLAFFALHIAQGPWTEAPTNNELGSFKAPPTRLERTQMQERILKRVLLLPLDGGNRMQKLTSPRASA